MQAVQTLGIDLPLKALAGRRWDGLACLQRSAVARHGVDAGLDQTLHAMADALAAVAREATAASAEER